MLRGKGARVPDPLSVASWDQMSRQRMIRILFFVNTNEKRTSVFKRKSIASGDASGNMAVKGRFLRMGSARM